MIQTTVSIARIAKTHKNKKKEIIMKVKFDVKKTKFNLKAFVAWLLMISIIAYLIGRW